MGASASTSTAALRRLSRIARNGQDCCNLAVAGELADTVLPRVRFGAGVGILQNVNVLAMQRHTGWRPRRFGLENDIHLSSRRNAQEPAATRRGRVDDSVRSNGQTGQV